MALLVRKFNNFLKKIGSSNRFQKKESRNLTFKNKNSKEKFSCHEGGKAGHLKYQCLVYLKKVEGEKNTYRDFKSKKAYIVWDVPEDDSTTSTSDEEELQRFVSCSSNSPTYDELYNAFVELHEELKKVAKINVDCKRVILLHEKKIGSMQKEIAELKLENETLDLIYSSASCICSTKVIETPEC
ncbi:hypothetical protein Lal_00024451 [Lupinus albus]|nr:hypothetical protein Lal_00024451 [Lupinus albus]